MDFVLGLYVTGYLVAAFFISKKTYKEARRPRVLGTLLLCVGEALAASIIWPVFVLYVLVDYILNIPLEKGE